jgi:alpha-L-fucosidase 2
MLLQSHTKYIDLLPALPAALTVGEVKGLCARGGFVLNLKWQDGKLQQAVIVSNAGKDCVIRYNGKVISLKTEKGKTYRFNGELKRL